MAIITRVDKLKNDPHGYRVSSDFENHAESLCKEARANQILMCPSPRRLSWAFCYRKVESRVRWFQFIHMVWLFSAVIIGKGEKRVC